MMKYVQRIQNPYLQLLAELLFGEYTISQFGDPVQIDTDSKRSVLHSL